MKSKIVWSLVALNALLLAVWIGRTMTQPALAENRRVSDYLTIPGELVQSESSVVYIVDVTSGQLGALNFDATKGRLMAMPPIDLNRVFDQGAANKPSTPRRPK